MRGAMLLADNRKHERIDSRRPGLVFACFAFKASATRRSSPMAVVCARSVLAHLLRTTVPCWSHQQLDGRRPGLVFAYTLFFCVSLSQLLMLFLYRNKPTDRHLRADAREKCFGLHSKKKDAYGKYMFDRK